VDKATIKMLPNEHPNAIFNRMYMVKQKYAHRDDLQISEQNSVGLVVNGCTDAYRPVFLTTYLQNKHLPPSENMVKLKEIAQENYATMVKSKETVSEFVTSDEVGLFSGMGHKSAKDKWRKGQECYLCGSKKHKAYNCPKKTQTNTGGGNGGGNGGEKTQHKGQNIANVKCYFCQQKGHISKNCFEREDNASRRPSKWVSKLKGDKRETGTIAVEEQSRNTGKGSKKDVLYDTVCTAIERPDTEESFASLNGIFLDNFDLLYDPNVFICDTGASTHSMSSSAGIINKRKVDQRIVGDGGQVAKQNQVGDLPCVKLDKNGETKFTMLLSDVTIGPVPRAYESVN